MIFVLYNTCMIFKYYLIPTKHGPNLQESIPFIKASYETIGNDWQQLTSGEKTVNKNDMNLVIRN